VALKLAPGVKYMKKEQAEAILNARLLQMNAGTYVPPSGITLGEMLDRWYGERCQPRLAPASLSSYRLSMRMLAGALGQVPLENLTPGMVEAAYGRLQGEGKGAATILRAHKVLHAALRYAVKSQLVARNVAEYADAPAPRRREMRALGPQEADRLLEALSGYSLRDLIALALRTGLRRGELLGLRWEDIELDAGVLHVRRILQRIDGQLIIKGPKTAKSRRDVYLDPEAVALLRDLRARNPHEYVFCKPDGSPYNPTYVSRKFKQIARVAGFSMRLHDLRHTFATLALASGVAMKVLQEMMGHEDLATTADTYTHVLAALKKDAARAIGNTLKNAGHRFGTDSDRKPK
jgi:integrase